jgi:putative transposase
MLNDIEFEKLCLSLNWSIEACELVSKVIRSMEAARLVRGRRGNVRGRYPSRKMGCVIQFESHTCELPWILDMEYHQDDVLEYWDQPLTFKIEYKNKSNRNIGTTHTPDFFVIRNTHAEFVECKTEEELIRLANDQPGKYYLGTDGQWRCPPGEKYAGVFGFKYRVVSTAEIDRVQIRNTVFLEDYLGEDTPPVADEQRRTIVSIVVNEQSILLLELLERVLEAGCTADDVYTLIAQGIIFVDLRAEALAEPNRVWVYPDKESAQMNTRSTANALLPKGKFIDVKEGERILWNDSVLSIVYVGDSKIFLEGERGAEPCLTFSHFENLVKRGEIQGIRTESDSDPDSRWKAIWNNANEGRKNEANRRLKILLCHLDKRPLPEEAKPRSLARWKSKYKAAERAYGNGLVGLLPAWHLRGDSKSERLQPEARRLMLETIENKYETIVQKGRFLIWGELIECCKEKKLKYPSYMTFTRYVKNRPEYLQTLKRRGHRAAYASKIFYYWLETDTPRHGDRPFEVCHIDHTELDIELIDPNDGENLGRPWATFLVDAYSRRIIAIYLTYDPPSYRSNMMVMRDCVRRTGRLPQTIVVDGGGDLHGSYFVTFAAAFEATIKTRPGAEPRFGSVIERIFNTANKQFVHNLIGNTQLTRTVRQITKENNPKRLAVWSLGPFYEALCDWAFTRYDTQEHWTLKQSPRDAYHSSLRLTGFRRHRLIRYDEDFQLLTLPTTNKETAKNMPGRGVKINNEYYWCDELALPEFEGLNVPVRYDPFNYAVAYVYLKDKWVKCLAYNHLQLEGCTEREQKIMSAEKRARDKRFSRQLADRAVQRALKHREDQEMERAQSEKLRLVRKKQLENNVVLTAINGGFDNNMQTESPSNASEMKQKEGNLKRDASLFSDIDLSNLISLEAYKG